MTAWNLVERHAYAAVRLVGPYKQRGLHAKDKAAIFDGSVIEHIGRLTPRRSGEIRLSVAAEWGEVTERHVFYSLNRLLGAGLIVRTPDGYLLARSR